MVLSILKFMKVEAHVSVVITGLTKARCNIVYLQILQICQRVEHSSSKKCNSVWRQVSWEENHWQQIIISSKWDSLKKIHFALIFFTVYWQDTGSRLGIWHTFGLNAVFQYALLIIILGLIGWQTLSLGSLSFLFGRWCNRKSSDSALPAFCCEMM